MSFIVKATKQDVEWLADIAKQTFIESHGISAKKTDIDFYVNEKCSIAFFREELKDSANIYYLIYHQGKLAGYSKIVLDSSHSNIHMRNITKLERLYLLKDFYKLGLGLELFKFNVELSKRNNQAGIWLFVWKGNQRALRFYIKNGFKVVGIYDFTISPTHSNPNHQLFLSY